MTRQPANATSLPEPRMVTLKQFLADAPDGPSEMVDRGIQEIRDSIRNFHLLLREIHKSSGSNYSPAFHLSLMVEDHYSDKFGRLVDELQRDKEKCFKQPKKSRRVA